MKLTASKLKKIADLTEREKAEKISLEKLKRAYARLEKDIAAKEELKFPVADEEIIILDKKGGRPIPLPEPKNRVNFPPHLVADLLLVWDFLYTFRKEISLKEFELDVFIDVLIYNSGPSTVLAETCSALLRTILGDEQMASRLDEELPKELFYGYRGDLTRKAAVNTASEAANSDIINSEYAQLCPSFALSAQFDSSCAALKLLNARHPLRTTEVDSLKWQAILRAVFPRLDAFRDLQRAQDIDGDLAASRYEGEGADGDGHNRVNLDYKFSIISSDQYNVYPYQSSLQILNCKLNKVDMQCVDIMEVEESLYHDEVKRVPYIDLCVKAVQLLQEKEFHELDLELKLVVLKYLVISCYDCESIQDKVACNAEERANQITANNKLKYEEKKRLREASNSMKDVAIERCRKINEAKEKADQKSAADKQSVQKKLNFKAVQGDSKPSDAGDGPKGGKNSGKSQKSNLEPSPAQLSAMLEEMVILSNFDIDVVLPVAPELDEVSDNEEDIDNDETADAETRKLIDALSNGRSTRDKGLASRAQHKSARDRDRDRNQRRIDRREALKSRDIASGLIQLAVQSRRERDVRDAIKAAKACGFHGKTESGETYVTEELKKLYEVQYQIDADNKDASHAQKLEKALAELFVRTEPIGQDRYFRSYYCFEGDDRLFVQAERNTVDLVKLAVDNGLNLQKVLRDKKSKKSGTPSKKRLLKSDTNSEDISTNQLEIEAPNVNPLLLEQNRPSRHDYVWSVFRSDVELWQLVEALDERGHRERALKNSIKARFDLQGEPPTPSVYLEEGSPYIGMKVKRTFGKGSDKYVMIGVITGWLPAVKDKNTNDPAFWNVLYADGDSEDLDEKEVKQCLIGSVPQENVAYLEMDVDGNMKEDGALRKSSRVASSNSLVSADESKTEETIQHSEKDLQLMPFVLSDYSNVNSAKLVKNEFYQPGIVRLYTNSYRGGVAFKPHTIGDIGLRSEFLALMNQLLEGLKARGSQWPRSSTRRTWEASVREAETPPAFRALLLELEAVVRETQKLEDTRQEEELENMRKLLKKRLEDEGWIFSKEQLADNSNYADAVLESVSMAPGVAVNLDIKNEDSSVSKKRTREESEVEGAIKFKIGDILHPDLPLLAAKSDVFVPSVTMDAIKIDAEGAGLIGITVRRFFRKASAPSTGTIVCFLPSVLNENEPLWHVLHDDGDEEDLDYKEVKKAVRACESDLDAPAEEDDFDDASDAAGDNVEGDCEEEASFGSDDDDDDSEVSFALNASEDPNLKRLWPSAYVRSRWCEAISECKTVSEVALGLAILHQQCSEFGAILRDPADISNKRVSRPIKKFQAGAGGSAKKRRYSLTPVKPKTNHRGNAPNNYIGSTPVKRKAKKTTSRKSISNSDNHFSNFGFYETRPVRNSRRNISYAE